MAKQFVIEFTKTYKTEGTAQKAVDRFDAGRNLDVHYSIIPTFVEGEIRFGVVFYGQRAIDLGIHFHFNVVSL